ncbi:hypothetical protein Ae201684P_014836 [Aphanomyces euteiches]|nr:hypothetical protein Ae201684P_014836 [Aphanomyces euteiches]
MPAIATPSPYDDIPHLKTFERVVQIELENVQGCEEQFLRSSTGLSSEMKDLGHKYGQKYFSFLLSGALCSSSRLGDLNRDQVMGLATDIIHRMVSSLDKYAPYVLRLSCAYILEKFEAAFPNSTRGPTIVVGGCIILRIVCPALIKPELMGFEPHTPRTLPNALLLAKLLQHAMRGTVFDMSSDELYYANDFIATTKDLVAGYLRAFPSTTKHVLIERLGDAPSTQQDTELRDIQALEPRRRPTTAIIIKSPKESCEDSPKRRFSLLSLFKTKSSGPTTPPATCLFIVLSWNQSSLTILAVWRLSHQRIGLDIDGAMGGSHEELDDLRQACSAQHDGRDGLRRKQHLSVWIDISFLSSRNEARPRKNAVLRVAGRAFSARKTLKLPSWMHQDRGSFRPATSFQGPCSTMIDRSLRTVRALFHNVNIAQRWSYELRVPLT